MDCDSSTIANESNVNNVTTHAAGIKLGTTVLRTQLSIPIISVSEQQSYTTGCANFNFSSRTDKRYVYSIDAYILKELSSYVPRIEDKWSDWSHIIDLVLADPQYYSIHLSN